MAILGGGPDQEILRVWGLISELSEQLTQNRSLSAALHAQLGKVKTQAIHSQTGFVLRRFNQDKPRETYEAELERMNSAMSAENQALLHDNKQLNALIKEYEQTLETVMSTFRTRANEVQEHELSLIREYETRLVAQETEDLNAELASSTQLSESLSRISTLLRQVIRLTNGEDGAIMPPDYSPQSTSFSHGALLSGLELAPLPTSPTQDGGDALEDDPELRDQAVADWALDRECELARLEKENEELRRLLAVQQDGGGHGGLGGGRGEGQGHERQSSDSSSSFISAVSVGSYPRHQQRLGGAAGTVGPFGTYKKMRGPG
ncbi:hypothetical protein JAAARDRAFT_54489 [Jaapia argillacea MUCL 33604]|uniref:Uncharacterized protein n=1 Tax=Jaapia argillacea MUCL 33604 TaxID=933084 RepID=A0A067QGC3_9AGAM|nr:hypothetical protein JAAARDRAFT_54489 [Jaapia argillacea MUCL 33604]